MVTRIAINGLGRIGRLVLRAIFELKRDEFELVMVNGPASNAEHAHLLKYDSVHGVFSGEISYEQDHLTINGKKILVSHQREIADLNWENIDVVLECSGKFNDKEQALKHITLAGSKKVLVSAPCSKADATIVFGVNDQMLKSEHQVISAASCTTNCLAPVVQILNNTLGIETGFMTTVHSYTNDQNILDASHKDLRRARTAGLSIIPTSTGAAKSLDLVLPELIGRLDGAALRVPTANVSLIDFSFLSQRDTSIEEINQIFDNNKSSIISVAEAPLVSVDFNHNCFSAVVDPFETKVLNKRFCRVVAWYDNEWAFSARMLDVANLISKI